MELGPLKRLMMLVKAMGTDEFNVDVPKGDGFSEVRTRKKRRGVLLGDTIRLRRYMLSTIHLSALIGSG